MLYEFVPSGHATMTDAKDYREMLINNNDFQNAVQGLSIIGMSRAAMDTNIITPLGTMSVIEYMASHDGINSIESTKHSDEKGRWILIVWKDKYDAAKAFVHGLLDKLFYKIYHRHYTPRVYATESLL